MMNGTLAAALSTSNKVLKIEVERLLERRQALACSLVG